MRDPIGIIIAVALMVGAIIALGWMTFTIAQHQMLRETTGKADLLRPELLREDGQ